MARERARVEGIHNADGYAILMRDLRKVYPAQVGWHWWLRHCCADVAARHDCIMQHLSLPRLSRDCWLIHASSNCVCFSRI